MQAQQLSELSWLSLFGVSRLLIFVELHQLPLPAAAPAALLAIPHRNISVNGAAECEMQKTEEAASERKRNFEIV